MNAAPEKTGIVGPSVSHPAAPQAAQAQNAAAWALASLPIAVALVDLPVGSIAFVSHLVSALGFVAAVVLVIADRRMLDRSGRLPRAAAPSIWRALLPPTYLYARARRLGPSLLLFWVSLAGLFVAAVLDLAVAGTAQDVAVLPRCAAEAAVTTARSAFDNMLIVRQEGIHAIAITDETEIGQGPGVRPLKRLCTATLRASDDVEYPVEYTIELTSHDEVIVDLRLDTQ